MEKILLKLMEEYRQGRDMDGWAAPCRPDGWAVDQLIHSLRILMFPGWFRREDGCTGPESYIGLVLGQARFRLEAQVLPLLLRTQEPEEAEANTQKICWAFFDDLPRLRGLMQLDLQAFLAGDPAAESAEEVIVSYPGFFAILVYRLAHALYVLGVPMLPRMMTELAHSRTGIDIHPGAEIAGGFFIDHGTGVVIGQTCSIGENVKLYQGVTLGAISTKRVDPHSKRHPTIEDGVTIYAGATVLGGDTRIGQGSTIGANAFLTASVPPHSRVCV